MCGKTATIGESYHIVGQELISWNKMEQYVMEAFQVEMNGMLHIPKEDIKTNEIFEYDELTNQHMSDYIFDNQKINMLIKNKVDCISFKEGIKETADLLLENENYRRIDAKVNERLNRIYEMYNR